MFEKKNKMRNMFSFFREQILLQKTTTATATITITYIAHTYAPTSVDIRTNFFSLQFIEK